MTVLEEDPLSWNRFWHKDSSDESFSLLGRDPETLDGGGKPMTQGEKEAWSRYVTQWVTLGTMRAQIPGCLRRGCRMPLRVFLTKTWGSCVICLPTTICHSSKREPWGRVPSVWSKTLGGEHRMVGPGRTWWGCQQDLPQESCLCCSPPPLAPETGPQ